MTNAMYNGFKNTVANANGNSSIWWDGFRWLDLTERQAKDIVSLLKVHPCIVREGSNLRLPSGIIVRS